MYGLRPRCCSGELAGPASDVPLYWIPLTGTARSEFAMPSQPAVCALSSASCKPATVSLSHHPMFVQACLALQRVQVTPVMVKRPVSGLNSPDEAVPDTAAGTARFAGASTFADAGARGGSTTARLTAAVHATPLTPAPEGAVPAHLGAGIQCALAAVMSASLHDQQLTSAVGDDPVQACSF